MNNKNISKNSNDNLNEESKTIINDKIKEDEMLLEDDELEKVSGGEAWFTNYDFNQRVM